MVNQLSGLVSGKLKKPLIVNGHLVTVEGRPVLAHRENYKVVLSATNKGSSMTVIEEDEKLLGSYADAFNEKYKRFSGSSEDLTEFYANADTFSGAIVLHNALYDTLVDQYNKHHFHDGLRQFPDDLQALITDFNTNQMLNYFEIYLFLLNRRLTSSHMPIKIKSHLVAGLFQPLIVQTKNIHCPLTMGEFRWFFDYLNRDEQVDILLEGINDTARGLGLTVIAMSDLSKRLGVPCVKELPRLYFQCMLYTILIDTISPEASTLMLKKFTSVFQKMRSSRAEDAKTRPFFNALSESVERMRSRLMVRKF